MYKLKVAANKLNLRNTPNADPSYANWAGDLLRGEEFVAESIVRGDLYNGTDLWAKDNFNRYMTISGLGDDDPRIPWSLKIFGVPYVWNDTQGEGVKIATIDSGIDMTNPDLKSAVVGGFNILTNTEFVSDENEDAIQDLYFHGTYCASIMASRGNKLFGVAPKAELIIVKIANDNGGYNYQNEIRGLRKAIELEPDIISMSFGNNEDNDEMNELIKQAINDGIICVAATGDNRMESNVEFPANIENMISTGSVLALDKSAPIGSGNFEISIRSTGEVSRGVTEGVTIVAPGEEMDVYDLHGAIQSLVRNQGGTSFSTAYVAGVGALWLSLFKKRHPSGVNCHYKFRDFLISTANRSFAGFTGKFWGNGLINPLSLLEM
jgi:major intracellular serine protease